jgi:signal transduction histidine kinase
MRAALDSSVKNFSDDFDRELTRIYLDLQLEVPSPPEDQESWISWREDAVKNYRQRYQRWLAQAAHPQMVRSIYLVEPGLSVSQFDAAGTMEFRAATWPAELSSYRERFEQDLNATEPPLGPRIHRIETILEDVPALVNPVPNVKLLGERVKLRIVGRDLSFPGFVVVTLDAAFIRQNLLPELASRYFSAGGLSEYDIAVVQAVNPNKVVFTNRSLARNGEPGSRESAEPASSAPPSTVSSPAEAPVGTTPDAAANMFRVRFEVPGMFENIIRETDTRVSGKHQQLSDRIALQYFRTETSRRTATSNSNKRIIESGGNARIVIAGDKEPTAQKQFAAPFNAHVTLIGSEGGRWQVLATHRAGSLDAAVGSLRRRNLLISFGILVLLSLSVGLIVVSSRRANRLARQQIEFVAGVSHELRTPLAVIRSAGENLADGVVAERDQVRRYGELIATEGRRLSEMVEQTLEFAGIQSGKRSYKLMPAAPGEVVADAVTASRAVLEENQFELETQIEADLPMIMSDRSALSRAIQNLINNAVKYCSSDRWVRVAAMRDSQNPAAAILIIVEDRGPGIEPRDAARIFEPFYRGREAASAQIPGNGLGLSIVRHIVEAHGGDVRVESVPGRGSRFIIELKTESRAVVKAGGEESSAPAASQPLAPSQALSRTDP